MKLLLCSLFGHVPRRVPSGEPVHLKLSYEATGFLAGYFNICARCNSVYWSAKRKDVL